MSDVKEKSTRKPKVIITGIKPPEGYGDRLQILEEDRGKIYGDPFLSHQAIGLVWEGIFRNRYHEANPPVPGVRIGRLFPADLVVEMLAGFKLTRLARPTYHQDSVDDCKVYLSFSERFRAPNK